MLLSAADQPCCAPVSTTLPGQHGRLAFNDDSAVIGLHAQCGHRQNISITADIAVEVEAGADFDLSVGGAVEVEVSDMDIAAAAIEIECAMFTVS